MASPAADEATAAAEAGWERLEAAARSAAGTLADLRRRTADAEAEVVRLRAVLEDVTRDAASSGEGDGAEMRRLRAENAVLLSRTAEARTRIAALLSRLAVLEGR
ncbi:MAG TPA: hypothetical protein VFE05_18965 [Longimicrobiaceae bacterium]|jgi:hypothetical protein|nr:hypothetical protein [Longimicrobiaceae bacterium]